MTANQNFQNTKGNKIYRITFRAKVGNIPVVGEIDIATKKEKWEINHEEVIAKRLLEEGGGYTSFNGIIDAHEVL